MNKTTLNRAIYEAHRFLTLAEMAKDTVEEMTSKTNAAAKRASLDLTRALADMRRPG